MFKRVIWVGVGAVAGSASTVWAQRKVKTQIDRVAQAATPAHVADVARSKIVDVRETVTAAVTEGRTARTEAERSMRGTVDDRWGRRPRE